MIWWLLLWAQQTFSPELLRHAFQLDRRPKIQVGQAWHLDPLAIAQLERDLSPYLYGSPPMAQQAGRLLAAYRRQHYLENQTSLSHFGETHFQIFFEARRDGQVHERALVKDGRIFRPGRPFANGDLLAFSPTTLWFQEADALRAYSLPFQPTTALEQKVQAVNLQLQNVPDDVLFNFIFSRMDTAFTLMGTPQTLSGTYSDDTLLLLLYRLIHTNGYSLYVDSDGKFVLMRPGFQTSKLEQALSQVSIYQRGGLVSGPFHMEAERQSQPMQTQGPAQTSQQALDNYAIGQVVDGQYQLIRLSQVDLLAKALVQRPPEEWQPDTCAALDAYLQKACLNKAPLIAQLRATLQSHFSTWQPQNPQHQSQARRLAACLQ